MAEDISAKRLFIGLSLSGDLKRDLEPVVKKLKATSDKKEISIRWSPKENWHLTLVFLGLTPNDKVDSLKFILSDFASTQEPVDIHLRQLGGFPEVLGARVLWAGVAASKKLLGLQTGLEAVLKPWGYGGEERAYTPHVTLARLKNQKNITDLISPWVRKDFGKAKVNALTLFESRPAGYFSSYVPLAQFFLSRESTDALQESVEGKN